MGDVYIAGVSLTPFGKDFRPIGVMLADACQEALKDSTAYCSDCSPDCLVIGSMDPIGFARQSGLDSLVGIELGLAREMEIYHVELGSATGAAAAFLVPSATDMKLTSVKSAFDNIKIAERKTLISLEAAVLAGRDAFEEANLNPHEINICELHDAFKPVPWIAVEDLALADRGKGHKCVIEEKNSKGRRVYVNRSGGFLARTHHHFMREGYIKGKLSDLFRLFRRTRKEE